MSNAVWSATVGFSEFGDQAKKNLVEALIFYKLGMVPLTSSGNYRSMFCSELTTTLWQMDVILKLEEFDNFMLNILKEIKKDPEYKEHINKDDKKKLKGFIRNSPF